MKPVVRDTSLKLKHTGSIHPQGWVPIETDTEIDTNRFANVAFTPKGGCPLKLNCQSKHGFRFGIV